MITFLAGIKERITSSHFNEGYRKTPIYKNLLNPIPKIKNLLKLLLPEKVKAIIKKCILKV